MAIRTADFGSKLKVNEWKTGESFPTIRQAQNLAKAYNRILHNISNCFINLNTRDVFELLKRKITE